MSRTYCCSHHIHLFVCSIRLHPLPHHTEKRTMYIKVRTSHWRPHQYVDNHVYMLATILSHVKSKKRSVIVQTKERYPSTHVRVNKAMHMIMQQSEVTHVCLQSQHPFVCLFNPIASVTTSYRIESRVHKSAKEPLTSTSIRWQSCLHVSNHIKSS